MADKIRYVYEQMTTMINVFKDAARQLDDTMTQMTQIAASMEQGSLLGYTGDVMAASVRQDLNGSINRLKLKLLEEADDIQRSMDTMKSVDGEAGQRFNN
jgi:uncharacterized protein YukE